MEVGLLFSSLTTFIVFVSSLFLAVLLIRRGRNNGIKSCGYFWLSVSFLWLFVALRLFFAWSGNQTADKYLFLVGQFFVFVSALPIIYYIFSEISKNGKALKVVIGIYGVLGFYALYIIFSRGLGEKVTTYFTTKYTLPLSAQIIFYSLTIPLMIGLVFLSVRNFLKTKTKEKTVTDFIIPLNTTLFIYLGIIDESGSVTDWTITFFRLVYVVFVLIIYVFFSAEQSESLYTFIENTENDAKNTN
jgi:hypothetical protein